ncbi:hypothetical protein Dimus_038082 [Dionaea muscipula]
MAEQVNSSAPPAPPVIPSSGLPPLIPSNAQTQHTASSSSQPPDPMLAYMASMMTTIESFQRRMEQIEDFLRPNSVNPIAQLHQTFPSAPLPIPGAFPSAPLSMPGAFPSIPLSMPGPLLHSFPRGRSPSPAPMPMPGPIFLSFRNQSIPSSLNYRAQSSFTFPEPSSTLL